MKLVQLAGLYFLGTEEFNSSNSMIAKVTLKEKIDCHKLVLSYKTLILENPLLQTKIVEIPAKNRFEWGRFSSEELECLLRFEEEQLMKKFAQEMILRQYYPTNSRLPFYIVVMDENTVFIHLSHIIANGKCFVFWIQKWLRYYADDIEVAIHEQSPDTNLNHRILFLMKRIKAFLWSPVFIGGFLLKAGKATVDLSYGKNPVETKNYAMKSYRFSQEATQRILRQCKLKQMTFTESMCALLAESLFEHDQEKERVFISIPMDLQFLLPYSPETAYGNLIASLPVQFFRGRDIDKQVKSVFKWFKRGIPYSLSCLMAKVSLSYHKSKAKCLTLCKVPIPERSPLMNFSLTYSNLGAISDPAIDKFVASISFSVKSQSILLVSSTVSGRLYLDLSWSKDLYNTDEVLKLFDRVLSKEYLGNPTVSAKEEIHDYHEKFDDAEYRLTSYQKDIWLEQCLYPGKPIYNLGGYLDIQGTINKDIFIRAVDILISENDSLRMRVIEKNSEPCLKLSSKVAYEVSFYDFSNHENPYQACLDWMEEEFLKPFSWDGNLFQFALLKADNNRYFRFTKFHHLIIDGFGIALMHKQIIENYNQLLAGIKETGRRTYSYTDFIAENQTYLNSQAFLSDKQFWKERYRTIPEPLFNRNTANDRDGSFVMSNRLTFSIKRSLYNQMIQFSEENGCTVFHFILGVLFVYFSRVCQKDEVVIGVPILNRGKAKFKKILGLFTNVLPLKINPGKDISFRELMVTIKSELMECYRHQKFPFGEIYRTVFEQVKEKSNIFDISLSFINQDFSENFVTASDYNIVSMAHRHERNALTIFVREYNAERDIDIDFDYQTGVFEKFIPIANVVEHFQFCLGQVLISGEKSLSEIEIIPKEEQKKILYGFNQTKAEYPRENAIHELFEAQVAKTPEHLAVVFGDQQLTYEELNAKANQLARLLRNKGVKPDDIVGILAERSMELVIGALGVLKAGGAYLPMDSNYPPDRIQYMLEDSAASILLTQKHLKERVAYQGEIIDIEDSAIYQGEGENLVNVSKPCDLGYIIYTSGSTGKPKGVMIEHRGIANLKTFFAKTCHLGEPDRMLQFASSSFDASVWEIFACLLTGGTLYIVPKEMVYNFTAFENFINQNGITIALLPPTYLTGIEPERISGLKQLFTGGSAITKGLVDKWKGKLTYYNAYGPTESTVIASTWKYNEQQLGNGSVPIGGPISNTEIYILDQHQRLLPIGVAGELCIGGDGLARGYLNRPELTAEKFVANPYCDGAKIYKTGDLARWLPDGHIEFLGRIDHQVKIRGFRIELGEIESALLNYPSVKEAVVIAREDRPGDQYLAAYFVSDHELTTDELKEHLGKELPEYMVPPYIVRLDSMPLTPNDKIDRKALPEPARDLNHDTQFVAPRDEKEAILAKVWQEVLRTERIGIRDNFFNLGGDSIKAIQVLSRLNAYQLKLEMKDLFKHPVIEELGDFVKLSTSTAEQGMIEGKIGMTPIQHWLFEQRFSEKHHFNQAVLLYRQEEFSEAILRTLFEKLVVHHDALRMVVRSAGDGPVLYNRGLEGQWDSGEWYSLEILDLLNDDNFRDTIESESNRLQASFDLDRGPLIKAKLFKAKTGDYLLIVIHHLVVDGISWRIILQDFYRGYLQASKNEPVQFTEKTDSFLTWSLRLLAYADSRELLNEVDYWAEVEAIAVKSLPKDRMIAKRSYQDIRQVQVELAGPDTEKLLKQANQAYHTEINDILLTALGLAVKEWTGEDQVLINLEGHGREEILKDIDISRTMGWFTAQYPVVLDMGGNRDLAYRMKAVKEQLRQIPNKGIGYGILKYLTLPENKKNLQFTLQPEISFNYLGQFDAEMENGAFTLSDISTGKWIAPTMECPYAIEISGLVHQGRLVLNFGYHQYEYDRVTMVQLAECFREKLVNLIDHCAAIERPVRTPSDFTIHKITLDELDNLFSNIDAGNVKDLYELSPMQEGLLYQAIKDNQSAAYFEQVNLQIRGRLDLSHLKESFNKLLERYDIFRTVFVYEKLIRPVQVVMKQEKSQIWVEDISHLPEIEKQVFLEEFKLKDQRRGFDLQKGPLIRLSIIQTGVDCYEVIWSFHHILMDGWCLGIVLKEFFTIYACLQENRLPERETIYPYSNYIQWLAVQDDAEAASYWTQYLNDFEEQTSLPKNSGLPVTGIYEREELSFDIDPVIRFDLENLARRNNVTFNTVFQAIWGLLLMRYNNTDDVVFGTVVSGRPHEITGVEKMIGLFINTLPVRIKADMEHSILQLLSKLQQAALDSEGYSYFPLAEIQTRTSLKTALFDHLIAFENYPLEEATGNILGMDAKVSEVFEQTQYDLNMVIFPGKELKIKFIYNSLVYEQGFIEKVSNHLLSAIKGILANPQTPLKDIGILTEEEELELLSTFNHTEMEYPKDKTIPELFEEQVKQTPDHPAVVFQEQQLTYKMLNEKANQLARVLRTKGIKAGSIVGIMAERSPEMITGLLGIWKAGGAYLPIDPDYPADRISYMLADSGTSILLTQKHLLDKLTFSREILCLDDPNRYSGGHSELGVKQNPGDLSYVIYTSGSTGKPKGVEIDHASLVNLVSWHQRVYRITSKDRATLVAGPAFDASVWETWPYLVSGAGLYIPDQETRSSTAGLVKWLQENMITLCFMPTPLAEMLLIQEWPRDISLRAMLTGGDKLHRRPGPDVPFALVNHYGPTENTVVATFAGVSAEEPRARGEEILPSIGRPMDNVQIYILDRYHNLQPVGVAGELCISGDGLARGYLNSPQLTAEKFVSNPFRTGTRMYKTGDLARWMPDGNIEFLGRLDHQVKIRGFRIELGEIENQLLKQESIKEAAVIAWEDEENDKYLAAYVVTDGELRVNELRAHLLKELPQYMVPFDFIQLDQLPLTANGKVDRKALPRPDGLANRETSYIAPRNEVDLKIQKIWQEILGAEKIGIDDNFFMLGGNSIKAIQVVSQMAQDFEIGMNDIFQFQTIRNLSDTIQYSKGRLKEMVAAMNDVAAGKEDHISFDGGLRSELSAYKAWNQRYRQIDFSETIHYENILLAGGTGYLGIHILHQLLAKKDSMIYLLVRAKNDHEARERLWAKLKFHFQFEEDQQKDVAARICVLSGDLSKEYLGLDQERYLQLAGQIDCIINSAANVKHYGHYSEFYEANVKGNQHLIEFANTGKKKTYNFISTTSVGSGAIEGKARMVFTEYDCNVGQSSDNYYVATKLEAEKLIMESRAQGLTANIFRVGNLVFDSASGVFQENIADNAFYNLLQSLIKIGLFPDLKLKNINFSFIDYVARAIVLLFEQKNLQNETYHIMNPHQLSLASLVGLLKEAGVKAATIPADEFIKYLLEKYEDEAVKSYITRILVHSNLFFEGASKTSFVICNQKTENILQALHFAWPKPDRFKVQLMVDHCRKVGFFDSVK